MLGSRMWDNPIQKPGRDMGWRGPPYTNALQVSEEFSLPSVIPGLIFTGQMPHPSHPAMQQAGWLNWRLVTARNCRAGPNRAMASQRVAGWAPGWVASPATPPPARGGHNTHFGEGRRMLLIGSARYILTQARAHKGHLGRMHNHSRQPLQSLSETRARKGVIIFLGKGCRQQTISPKESRHDHTANYYTPRVRQRAKGQPMQQKKGTLLPSHVG